MLLGALVPNRMRLEGLGQVTPVASPALGLQNPLAADWRHSCHCASARPLSGPSPALPASWLAWVATFVPQVPCPPADLKEPDCGIFPDPARTFSIATKCMLWRI